MSTRRLQAIAASLLIVGLTASCAGPPAPSFSPNVLFIVWDTVRADRLSAYGYDRPTTPNLEAFAKDARLFERAVSPGIWTLPSHASLFTGLPVSAHGTDSRHKWLDNRFRTIAETLGDAGYDTYAFSANPHVSENVNLTQGFDVVEHPWDEPWRGAVETQTRGKLIAGDASTELSPARDEMKSEQKAYFKESGPIIAEALAGWLDGRDTARPFFAFLNYMEAHVPRIPSLESRKVVMDPDLIEHSLRLDQAHLRLLSYTLGKHPYSERDIRAISGVYDASLLDLDLATKALFDELERRGVLDDTVVVLTSDHGENLGDHSMIGHKFCVYNTLVRVPLVVRYPRAVVPGRVKTPVSVLDVFSSVLELVGASVEADMVPGANLLTREFGPANAPVFSEMTAATPTALQRVGKLYGDFEWEPWLKTFRSVEHGDRKFIWSSNGEHELFDLNADAGESSNLIDEEPQRAADMSRLIDEWRATFPAYDAGLSGPDDRPGQLPSPIVDRLRALGYLE